MSGPTATDWINRAHFGDCLETLRKIPGGIANTCVTSPPYFGLRDYGHEGQIGLEETPEQFIAKLVEVFREVRRVLREDGTLWVNMGDSYSAGKMSAHLGDRSDRDQGGMSGLSRACGRPKNLLGIPWRLAFALQSDGWYLRQDIIWSKPNPMPESVKDRCTKSHEYIFLLSKDQRYYFDSDAMREEASGRTPGNKTEQKIDASRGTEAGRLLAAQQKAWDTRNRRSVWTVPTATYSGAHFATYPEELIEPCILSGAPPRGVVLDPFFGSGTTGSVAQRLGRNWIGCELNPAYKPLQDERLRQPGLILEAA